MDRYTYLGSLIRLGWASACAGRLERLPCSPSRAMAFRMGPCNGTKPGQACQGLQHSSVPGNAAVTQDEGARSKSARLPVGFPKVCNTEGVRAGFAKSHMGRRCTWQAELQWFLQTSLHWKRAWWWYS